MKNLILILTIAIIGTGCFSLSPSRPMLPSSESLGQIQYNKLTASIDRARIQTGHTISRDERMTITLFDTKDVNEIARLIHLFEIKEDTSRAGSTGGALSFRGNCGCSGICRVDYFKDNDLVLSFSIHHFAHIRSPAIYNGTDAYLTPRSRKRVKEELQELKLDDAWKKISKRIKDHQEQITIKPHGILQINIEADSSLNGNYEINDSGAIQLGYLGSIFLSTMTVNKAADKIGNLLKAHNGKQGNIRVKFIYARAIRTTQGDE